MPRIVAVIGASHRRHKYGNKALRAFARQGYTVIPINPNEREVEGYATYPSVLDVPGPIDMATVYVPEEVGIAVLDDIARKGIPEVWLNPGADEPAVVARAKELNLHVIQACSIMGIGESPGRY
jgi:predicted CoA-binding protein